MIIRPHTSHDVGLLSVEGIGFRLLGPGRHYDELSILQEWSGNQDCMRRQSGSMIFLHFAEDQTCIIQTTTHPKREALVLKPGD